MRRRIVRRGGHVFRRLLFQCGVDEAALIEVSYASVTFSSTEMSMGAQVVYWFQGTARASAFWVVQQRLKVAGSWLASIPGTPVDETSVSSFWRVRPASEWPFGIR